VDIVVIEYIDINAPAVAAVAHAVTASVLKLIGNPAVIVLVAHPLALASTLIHCL
jgi:hypothetical protein